MLLAHVLEASGGGLGVPLGELRQAESRHGWAGTSSSVAGLPLAFPLQTSLQEPELDHLPWCPHPLEPRQQCTQLSGSAL